MLMVAHWLQRIKRRCSNTTPGPWRHDDEGFVFSARNSDEVIGVTCKHRVGMVESLPSAQNAEFIAHAREDIPMLLAEIERLQQALESIANKEVNDPAAFAREVLRPEVDDNWMNRETVTF